jgi:hypothetical protein
MNQTGCVETLADNSKLTIRSNRRAHWFWLDNQVIDHYGALVGIACIGMYAALARYANNKTGTCWPSLGRLSTQLGCTRKSAAGYLQRLVDAKLIAIEERSGHTYMITLLDLPPLPEPQEPGCVKMTQVEGDPRKNDAGGASQLPNGCVKMTHEPHSSNQKERTNTPPNDVCDRKAETPRPVCDHRDDVLATIGLLPPTTQDQLAETARQSLLAEGVAPWFLIRPVLEARMIALWSAQSPEGWALATEDITTAARSAAPVG